MILEKQSPGAPPGRVGTIRSVVGGLSRSREREDLRELVANGVEQKSAVRLAREKATEVHRDLLRSVADELVSGSLSAWIVNPSGGYSFASSDTASSLFEQVRQWRNGNRSRKVFRPNPFARSDMTSFENGVGSVEPANVEWIDRLFISESWASSNPDPTDATAQRPSGLVRCDDPESGGTREPVKSSGQSTARPTQLDSIIEVVWRRARESVSGSPKNLADSGVPEGAAMREWRAEISAASLRYARAIADAICDSSLQCWRADQDGSIVPASPDCDRPLFEQVRRWQGNATSRDWMLYLVSINRVEDLDRIYCSEFQDVEWLDRLRIDASWASNSPRAPSEGIDDGSDPSTSSESAWPWGDYTTPGLDAIRSLLDEKCKALERGEVQVKELEIIFKDLGFADRRAAAYATLLVSQDKGEAAKSKRSRGSGVRSVQPPEKKR